MIIFMWSLAVLALSSPLQAENKQQESSELDQQPVSRQRRVFFTALALRRLRYRNGYRKGLRVGLARGYRNGRNVGYKAGYKKGSYGKAVAVAASYKAGRARGYKYGRASGYRAGRTGGYKSGYKTGRVGGYRSGYRAGKARGYKLGRVLGLRLGKTIGIKIGDAAGYKRGYSVGHAHGSCKYLRSPGVYLAGYPKSTGKRRYTSLSSAQVLCSKTKDCGGVTFNTGRYELRAGKTFMLSPSKEVSYLKQCN